MLISFNKFPPGGWLIWRQDKTQPIDVGGVTFQQAVTEMQRFRAVNPYLGMSTNPGEIAKELEEWTCERIHYDPQYCRPKKKAPEIQTSPMSDTNNGLSRLAPLLGTLGQVAHSVANLKSGASAITEWLGSGGNPVSPQTANTRSQICETCPHNHSRKALSSWTGILADRIKDYVAQKNRLSLHVDNEDRIGACEICDCPLALKVFVPIQHIASHTNPAKLAEFPAYCWIPKELNA